MSPHLVFWETTRACNLECPHCRAQATAVRSPEELSTDEAKRLIADIASFAHPILVFSGGEPLVRPDIYELIRHAKGSGLRSAIATNAAMIDRESARNLKGNGLDVAAVSLYGSNAKSHDTYCGRAGAFATAVRGIVNLKSEGIELQINTTVTRKNIGQIEALAELALILGASSFHPFFLVPTGRGMALEGDGISAGEYEEVFNRLYDLQATYPSHIKATCAPHYYRVIRARAARDATPLSSLMRGSESSGKGCLAGAAVAFISYRGEVFGCGYLPIAAGSVRRETFKTIWRESVLFKDLRDGSKLGGKCGMCEFKAVCGGCRARAYARCGNYLAEEPSCAYEPKGSHALI